MHATPPPGAERAPLERGAPGGRASKRRPRAKLRATGDEGVAVADWASLHGDLARRPSISPASDAPVEWRIHDRTHLEFAIDYPLARQAAEHTWEAYFFIPESFRLHDDTYDKKAIYDDLWSYVRYAVPTIPFHDLASLEAGSALARVRAALDVAAVVGASPDEAANASQQLRLFACLVRASGLSAMRDAERAVDEDPSAAASFVATCNAVGSAFRTVLAERDAATLGEALHVAASWTDEDVSLVLETLCATLGIALEARGEGYAEQAEQLGARAVAEARHRRERGYDSVGSEDWDERKLEHFEFRRHMLKRFTASVLWLSLEVRQAATWVIHTLYAVAAAAAMAFALAASVQAPDAARSEIRWALPLVVAYALKDRLKAILQTVFSVWIGRHFPDRKWSIRDHERRRHIGNVHERAAFLPFNMVPDAVLATRRVTRAHALEEQARPERVLWHRKTVALEASAAPSEGSDPSMLTEIFRLNLHRWLQHTDDPNRKVVFADPVDALVYQATTRRVYNIGLVYRLRSGAQETPWHRIRVVVSRKGIERIDPIC
jgi:hypothetical protein